MKMCWFFVVIKLLMLKILLAGLTGLIAASPYDYGYHPSAEEFDNLLRETRRTWTYNFLKADRDRLLIKPLSSYKTDNLQQPLEQQQGKTEAKYFLPKFQYENEGKKFHNLANNQHYELQQQASSSSSNKQPQLPLKNIGSTLDFDFFSAELPKPIYNTVNEQPLHSTTATTTFKPPSVFPEINLKPIAKPDILTSKNTTQDNFPIYFTNPATGIVYAITEVGKTDEKQTLSNGSIPIFITKEQYERDINYMKQEFELKCPQTKLTTRPQILKIQKKPLASVLPITSTKFLPPSTPPLKKPSPVVVKTELTVKDKKPTSTLRPLRKKKKKTTKTKTKLKKHNRPGRKTSMRTTLRPILANQPDGPVIIIGSRTTTTMKPLLNNEKLSTQLEKPNFDNIFSSATAPHAMYPQEEVSLDPKLFTENHKIKKRSPHVKTTLQNTQYSKGYQRDNAVQNNEKTKSINGFSNMETESNNFSPVETIEIGIQKNNMVKNGLKETNFKSENDNFDPLETTNQRMALQNTNKTPTEFQNGNSVHHKRTSSANDAYKSNEIGKVLQNFDMPVDNFSMSLKVNDGFSMKKFLKYFNNKITGAYTEKKPKNHDQIKKIRREYENILNYKNFNKNNSSKFVTETLKNIFFNITNQNGEKNFAKNLNNSKSENFSGFEIENYTRSSKDLENQIDKNEQHRLNKRSVNNLKPKFIKKLNAIVNRNQTDLKNSSEIQIPNSERGNNSNIQSTQNQNQSELKTSNTTTQISRNLQLKKRKRKFKLQTKPVSTALNTTKTNTLATTTSRTIRENNKKRKTHKNMAKKSKRQQQEADYYFFTDYDDEGDDEEDGEEEDEDYEDDDDEDENNEEVDNRKGILAYDDDDNDDVMDMHMPPLATSEASVSLEDLSEQPVTQKTKSSLEAEDNDNDSSAVQIEHIKFKAPAPTLLDYYKLNKLKLKTKTSPSPSSYYKKRIRRRPQFKIDRDDYDYDEEEDNSISSNLGGFFRMIFYPIQVVMGSVMDSFAAKDNEEEEDSTTFNPYTQYTSYHNTLKHQASDEYDEDYDSNESSGSSLTSWFSSWFGFNRRNKKIGSTTVAPVQPKPTKSNSWLPSWLDFGKNDRISTESTSTEDYDEYDKWFASWFGETKPKARKRTTTTTSTTTQLPHVPILTIVDPMKNPQNWIGILAHHIINHTSTSTANPLKDIWSKVTTTTTTENPEIPRKISYDKYQIWRLKPQDDAQVKALEEYKKSEDGIKLQWLKGPSLRGLTDVLVPPKMLVDFQASLTFELIDHEVLIFDVGKAIAYEKTKEDYFFTTTTQKPKKHKNKTPSPNTGMTWHKYYEYDDIIKYLESMRMRFPHLVELIHIGRSYEGRPLIVMKIESKEAAAVNSANYPAHQRNKLRHKKRIGLANAVFIEAGIHGMEWIGPATATWIINELLRIMKKNVSDDQSFIRNTTWYIMPILNPDGYVYSHEYDRFWKKSRSRHISRPLGILNSAMTWLQKKRAKEKICFGVDLDRNWHYQWGRRGSSKSPCNEFYAGPTPFSEPETKSLSEFLMDYRTQIKLFISMQAYGQIISYPYKANTTYDTERLDDLLDVAMVGTDGLRKKGSKARYKIDSSNDLVENRSGCSDAFAAYEVGIPFSYTMQLADNGVHGYLLPSASIESTAKDAFEIVTGMLDYI